jgi:putative sigma-54 modulation protein
MNVNITARHFNLRDSYKEAITNRLEKLKRFYEGSIDCDVVLEYRNKMQIAEFRLRIPNRTFLAETESDKMMKSIDLAFDDLEQQLRKHKDKLTSKKRSPKIALP